MFKMNTYDDKPTYMFSPELIKYKGVIYPASSAVGVNGCTDCHSYQSGFFTAPVLKYPFDEEGKPVTQSQFTSLGFSAVQVHSGILRETFLKPLIYVMVTVFVVLLLVAGFRRLIKDQLSKKWLNGASLVIGLGALGVLGRILFDDQLSLYMLIAIIISCITGLGMLAISHWLVYTLFDLGLVLTLMGGTLILFSADFPRTQFEIK